MLWKKNTSTLPPTQSKPKLSTNNHYEPTISVSTKKGSEVSISVKDNDKGIPEKVLDKIFQPFFTTNRQSRE